MVRIDLDDLQVELNCPVCGYPIFVLGSEVATQVHVRCPCCRTLIRLVDQDGSMHTAARDIESALKDMLRTLRGQP